MQPGRTCIRREARPDNKKPTRETHYANSSSSALASLRLSVSKPSVLRFSFAGYPRTHWYIAPASPPLGSVTIGLITLLDRRYWPLLQRPHLTPCAELGLGCLPQERDECHIRVRAIDSRFNSRPGSMLRVRWQSPASVIPHAPPSVPSAGSNLARS
jgi:hypothetical protein